MEVRAERMKGSGKKEYECRTRNYAASRIFLLSFFSAVPALFTTLLLSTRTLMHEFVSGNRKTTVKPIRDKGRERDDFLSKVKWKE